MTSKFVAGFVLIAFFNVADADQGVVSAAEIDSQSTAYILSVDANSPGIDYLNNGNYEAAINEARSIAKHSQALSAHFVMCAAHIRNASKIEAEVVCNQAIELAEQPITTSRNPHGHKNREALAMAYSNRGVLRSIYGDHDGANVDFARALQQNRNIAVTRHNKGVHEAATQFAQNIVKE